MCVLLASLSTVRLDARRSILSRCSPGGAAGGNGGGAAAMAAPPPGWPAATATAPSAASGCSGGSSPGAEVVACESMLVSAADAERAPRSAELARSSSAVETAVCHMRIGWIPFATSK
jgi:hypothetical protein